MVQKIQRYIQIADVLWKYGFGVFVHDLLPGTRRFSFVREKYEEKGNLYERIRKTLEELGPTFVKFGQQLSTREDLLPAGLIVELSKLRDNVSPIPFQAAMDLIRAEWPEIDQFVDHITPDPVGSASLSQVYRAVLKDSRVIALKIKRPGIDAVIETDIVILTELATRVTSLYPEARYYDPQGLVADFAFQIRRELDFINDGSNARKFGDNFQGFDGIRFPLVYPEYSTRNLLVMEFVEGVRIQDVQALASEGVDLPAVARTAFHAYLKQIFEDGFFHGDPHPGNILVNREGVLIFLDFGRVYTISPDRRLHFIRFLHAVVIKDPKLAVRALESLGVHVTDRYRIPLMEELYSAFIDIEGTQIGHYKEKSSVYAIFETFRRYKISVPGNLLALLQVLNLACAIGIVLDPQFEFTSQVKPYLQHLLKEENKPGHIARKFEGSVFELLEAVSNLPTFFTDLMAWVGSGTIRVEVVETDIRRLQASVDRASSKILLGLVIGAIVVGSSIIIIGSELRQAMRPAETIAWYVEFIAILGYLLALAIGLFAVLRVLSRRNEDDW